MGYDPDGVVSCFTYFNYRRNDSMVRIERFLAIQRYLVLSDLQFQRTKICKKVLFIYKHEILLTHLEIT